MTFLEIRQRIAEVMGEDSTDTTTDNNATMVNKLKEWVNARYRVLAAKRSWNWRLKDLVVQTRPDITTGTVDVTQNSTTITFSVGPTPSVKDWFIQFDDSDDWFQITLHTATETGATLAAAFAGTTNSTASYVLRKVYYPLAAPARVTVGKILNCKQTRDDIALRYMTPRRLDQFVSDRTRSGEPEFYSVVGLDSNRDLKVEFYPVPNVAMNITFRVYIIPEELSADGDIPILPLDFHDIIVWDVLSTYGFMFLDDTRLSAAKAERNELFDAMIDNEAVTEDMAIRQPFDMGSGRSNSDVFLKRLDLPIN